MWRSHFGFKKLRNEIHLKMSWFLSSKNRWQLPWLSGVTLHWKQNVQTRVAEMPVIADLWTRSLSQFYRNPHLFNFKCQIFTGKSWILLSYRFCLPGYIKKLFYCSTASTFISELIGQLNNFFFTFTVLSIAWVTHSSLSSCVFWWSLVHFINYSTTIIDTQIAMKEKLFNSSKKQNQGRT